VEDTKVVASAAPSNETTDPAMNPTPVTVSVKLPVASGEGLTDEMLGSGRMVTRALPVDVGEVVLAARTVTVWGPDTDDGAKYRPPVSITPTMASPPAMPLTLQLTVFGAPLTVAANV
jgi:hypothetical protein